MKLSGRSWYVIGTLAAAALLGGCNFGGSASPGFAPGASVGMSGSRGPTLPFSGVKFVGSVRPDHGRSGDSPDAKSAPSLLFVSDNAGVGLNHDVYIFTWPGLKLKRMLTGFSALATECTDTKGNVYIAESGSPYQIFEYSHTGDLLNTYNDSNGWPAGCAVNPTNGDLAVTNYIGGLSGSSSFLPGNVLIYSSPSLPPKVLQNPNEFNYYFVAYDRIGHLWEDGDSSDGAFVLSSCGKKSCKTVDLSGPTIHLPGALLWDAARGTLVVFDWGCSGRYGYGGACSYPVSASGVLGSKTTYSNFNGGQVCELGEAVLTTDGKYVVGGDYGSQFQGGGCYFKDRSTVDTWDYPAGGTPVKYRIIHKPGAWAPAGAAISTK